MELLLFHHGQTGYFHVRRGRAELCQSSSVVVLDGGEHLSVPGARPADSAMPKEDFASSAPWAHETRCLNGDVVDVG